MNLPFINTCLLIAIIAINGYVLVLPLLPQATFWWQSSVGAAQERLIKTAQSAPSQTAGDNRLVIPAMLLDKPVFTGPDIHTLDKGLWLRPTANTPDKAGNTVIVGHRFVYNNPDNTFYFLDKVKIGDEIALFWQGKKYRYTATSIRVVPATATSVESPTKEPQLTLYTCTPLWDPKDRLVVVARLEAIQ